MGGGWQLGRIAALLRTPPDFIVTVTKNKSRTSPSSAGPAGTVPPPLVRAQLPPGNWFIPHRHPSSQRASPGPVSVCTCVSHPRAPLPSSVPARLSGLFHENVPSPLALPSTLPKFTSPPALPTPLPCFVFPHSTFLLLFDVVDILFCVSLFRCHGRNCVPSPPLHTLKL